MAESSYCSVSFAHGGEVRDASERLAMRANELSHTRQGGKWVGEPD